MHTKKVGFEGYGQSTGGNSNTFCCRLWQLHPWGGSLGMQGHSYQPRVGVGQWKNSPTLCPSSGTASEIPAYLVPIVHVKTCLSAHSVFFFHFLSHFLTEGEIPVLDAIHLLWGNRDSSAGVKGDAGILQHQNILPLMFGRLRCCIGIVFE